INKENEEEELYYVGSEIPGVYVGRGDPDFQFKVNGKIRPQAARFRIYGYKDDVNMGEIDLSKFNGKVEIKWTVVLANKKAAHRQFKNRSTLMAIQEQSLTYKTSNGTGELPKPKVFKPRVYRQSIDNREDGQQLYLGKMIIEKEG
ncbi:8595_t:CDS:2, partial [Racocetra fulgida]